MNSVSKPLKTVTNCSDMASTIGAIITGRVTRSIVRRLLEPETRAACSSAPSMLRKAAVSRMILKARLSPITLTQTMPLRL